MHGKVPRALTARAEDQCRGYWWTAHSLVCPLNSNLESELFSLPVLLFKVAMRLNLTSEIYMEIYWDSGKAISLLIIRRPRRTYAMPVSTFVPDSESSV